MTTQTSSLAPYTLEKLGVADAGRLLEFYQSLSPATVFFYQPFEVIDMQTMLNHLTPADAGQHLSLGLAAPDGSIEGHVFVLDARGKKPIFGIGLRDRIQSQGWGRKIASAILAQMDAWDVPLVTLTVVKENVRAFTVYKSLEFVLIGDESFRQPNDSYYMERLKPDGTSI
jgi:ribosomal protein S18 acetylase RimI-like enzyme